MAALAGLAESISTRALALRSWWKLAAACELGLLRDLRAQRRKGKASRGTAFADRLSLEPSRCRRTIVSEQSKPGRSQDRAKVAGTQWHETSYEGKVGERKGPKLAGTSVA